MPEVHYRFEVYYVPEAYRDEKQHVLSCHRNWLKMRFATNDEITNSTWARGVWLDLKRAFPEPFYYVHVLLIVEEQQWINENIDKPDFEFFSSRPWIRN